MSTIAAKTLPIERTKDGLWAVEVPGEPLVVQHRTEAELLSYIPVEDAKMHWDGPGNADVQRIREIIRVANEYGLYSRMPIIRRFDAWLREHDAGTR